MSFHVRLAGTDDIPKIDLLYSRSYPKLLKPDYAPSLLVTVVPLFSKSQPHLVTSGSFYVAETRDAEIVGAGGWTKQGPRGERSLGTGHIRHFATDPDATRLGIASELMQTCVVQAAASGVDRLSCYSTITAEPFYRAMGFRQKSEIELEFGQTMLFPAIHMIRDLP